MMIKTKKRVTRKEKMMLDTMNGMIGKKTDKKSKRS